MTIFPSVAPRAVTKTTSAKLCRLMPVAEISAVAIRVYETPKKAVAFATKEKRKSSSSLSREEINRCDASCYVPYRRYGLLLYCKRGDITASTTVCYPE